MNEFQKKQAATIEAISKSNTQLQESLNKANTQNLKITQEISDYQTKLHDMDGKIKAVKRPLLVTLIVAIVPIIALVILLTIK